MKNRKLKNTANTICQMFCGWRIFNSTFVLNSLGSGILSYDLLQDTCYFNNNKIELMPICFELKSFLSEDLNRMNIEITQLSEVILTAKIIQTIIDAKERKTISTSLKNNKPINKGKFYQYYFDCKCIIATTDRNYEGLFYKIEEWPDNWP